MSARAVLLALVLASSAAAGDIPFQVPPGFVVEKIAGPPLVERPVFACFDDRGRLYVADNAGRNLKADELLKELPNCIRRLEDTDGDGVFDKSTVFADKLSFPMGVLWHDGAVYACSPPSLWKFDETTGQRTELVTKFGFTGNAADIHGPFLSPDGRLYWTDGRHGHEIRQKDGKLLTGKAARIFRCKPDGTEVEVVCGGGMDDPVEMAFTEEGEPFAVVDIFQARPARMDALIYCIDGGVFPYYEAVLGEFKRTGPLLPAVSELGWVAPSGLTRYRGRAFGPGYTDNLFSTQFNRGKVVRHILERVGASFKSRDEDFITSTSPDFHPTSVREDADGSLIVIDTGGWFRIGCPTSKVAKPEVLGGIYRVRRQGAPTIDDPRGQKIPWKAALTERLIQLLDDPRPVVRDLAMAELARRGDAVVDFLGEVARKGDTPRLRRNAVWVLGRIGTKRTLDNMHDYLQDGDESVRQVAVRILGIHRHFEWRNRRALADRNPAVRREAAIAAGRSNGDCVYSVLAQLAKDNDRFLEHALIHALIEIGDRSWVADSVRDRSPRSERAALIALDQMANGNLTKDEVFPHLSAADRALQQTAWDIVLRRPAWIGDVVAQVRGELTRAELPEPRRETLTEALARAGDRAPVQSLVADLLADAKTPAASRRLLLDVIATAAVAKLPPAWLAALRRELTHGDTRAAIDVVRSRGLTDCDTALEEVIQDAKKPADVRIAALAVSASRRKALSPELFELLLGRLKADGVLSDRLAAADALGQSPLSAAQRTALAADLSRCSPTELARLRPAFERSGTVPKEFELRKPAGDDAAKLAALAGVWKDGDADRGKAVFFGQKAQCATCHAVGGVGERIGPDLSKVGALRTENDLLEAIVLPSAGIARGYESYVVHTVDGKSYTGVMRRETADAVVLVTAERAEVRLARGRIEAIEVGKVSVMPQGLEVGISRRELGDLIVFLKSLR